MSRGRRSEVAMSAADVDAFLHGRHTMSLATMGLDGRPHLVAMWYGFVGGEPGFLTYRGSQKHRNLSRDPRVTCLVEAGDTYDELRGVQIKGRAILLEDEPRRLALAYDVTTRYQGPPDDADPAALRAQIAKRLAYRIEVEHVASWDHRQLFRS